MTERERWIVYPLLILALGAAARDNFGGPDELDVTKIHCSEIRAAQLVIADPHDSQPRIVLRSVPEPKSTTAQTAGQIELLDHAQRPQTIIQQGIVHSPLMRTTALAVVDPAGRPKVVVGVKVDAVDAAKVVAAKGQSPRTSGIVEVFGKDSAMRPMIQLATSAEGGCVLTQREGLALGVAIGSFPWGSGPCLQIGERMVPLPGSISERDIKKLEGLSQEQAKKPRAKDEKPHAAQEAGPGHPATVAPAQSTNDGAATKP